MKRFILLTISILFFNPLYATEIAMTNAEMIQAAQQIDMSAWNGFADKIKNCTPSTLELPNPQIIKQILMITAMREIADKEKKASPVVPKHDFDQALHSSKVQAEILGWQGENCQVRITISTQPTDKSPEQIPPEVKHCLIPKDLILFVVGNINTLTTTKMTAQIMESDALSTIISKVCK